MADYTGLIRVGIEGLGQIRQLNTALERTSQLIGNLENAQVVTGQIAESATRNVNRAAQRRAQAGRDLSGATRTVANVAQRRDPDTGRFLAGGPNATARRLANAQLGLAQRDVRESDRSLREQIQNRRLIAAAEGRYARAVDRATTVLTNTQGRAQEQQLRNQQTMQGIGNASRGNYLTNLFQGRGREFARGGAGAALPSELQQQARNVRAAWDIATAGGQENLRLMQRLATEMSGLVRQQNELNRGRAGRSIAFEAGRRGQERITDLSRMQGADPGKIRGLRSQATNVIYTGNTVGDIAGSREAARRMNVSIGRYERELNGAARELSAQQRAQRTARRRIDTAARAAGGAVDKGLATEVSLNDRTFNDRLRESKERAKRESDLFKASSKEAGKDFDQRLQNRVRERQAEQRSAVRDLNTRSSWQKALSEMEDRKTVSDRERSRRFREKFLAEEKRQADLGIGVNAPTRIGGPVKRTGAIPMGGQGGRQGMFNQYPYPAGPGSDPGIGEFRRINARGAFTQYASPAGPGNPIGIGEFQRIQKAQREQQRQQGNQKGFFQGDLRSAIGDALIGGAFPALFGQGLGASAGGLAGGLAGGAVGGNFGFGLSLVGTAIGQAVDTTVKNLTTLADAIRSPSKALDALEASGLASSRSLEKTRLYVDQLTAVGRTYDAQSLVLQKVQERLGPGSLTELGQLDKAQQKVQEQFGAIASEIQVRLLPVLQGFIEFLGSAAGDIGGFSSQSRTQRLDPQRFEQLRSQAIRETSGPFGAFGDKRKYEARLSELSKQELSKRFANERASVPLTPEEKLASETSQVQESRKLADQIQSAYREAFSLQRQAYDLQRDGAMLNRDIADYSYKKEREIFDLRQQAAEKQIENNRARAQNRIEGSDLSARQTFAAATGFEQQLLTNVRESVRARKEGEADIEQSRKRLELAMARLNRDLEDYKRTNAREIEDIEQRKLSYVRSVEDYKMKVADHVLQRAREAADLMRQAMTLPDMGAAAAGGSTGAVRAGAVGGVGNMLPGTKGGPNINEGVGYGRGRLHAGRDLGLDVGDPIHARRAGVVTQSYPSGFGKVGGAVVIKYDDGMQGTYGHTIPGVRQGQKVEAGQRIATVATDPNPSNTHLHYELRDQLGKLLEPLAYVLASIKTSAVAAGTPQGQTATQISNIPGPKFSPVPVGATPSAAPVNAANMAARLQLVGGEKEALKILEEQSKLKQRGIELGQIEQILQASQLPQLKQQGDTLKQQIEARQRILGLSDNAASVADIEAESKTRLLQIEKDRASALAKAQKQYGSDPAVTKQINNLADKAAGVAKDEEKQRRINLDLSNKLQNQERSRSAILQLQENLAIGKAEAAALERGELQATNVELLRASTLYQFASDAEKAKLTALTAQTEELGKQNELNKQINGIRQDARFTGAGLRAGLIGAPARAYEQGLKDFKGDTTKAMAVANETKSLESQQLVWANLEKDIVSVSDAISGALTNGLVDIVSGARSIQDVGRDMLNSIAGSFADSAQQQLGNLMQRQLGGLLGGQQGPLVKVLGAGAEAAGPQALGSASMLASGQVAAFGMALQAVTAQMAFSSALGGGSALSGVLGSAVSGAAPNLFGNALSSNITDIAFGGFLANGGTAQAGKGYVVGEKEPEFFFPGVTGRVVPRSDMEKAAALGQSGGQADPLELDYTVTERQGERMVTEEQMRRNNALLLKQAQARTLASMRNNKEVRDFVNI
jgi:murein DD-endopeptidase MepM/ murein hydrolase activator NlpD